MSSHYYDSASRDDDHFSSPSNGARSEASLHLPSDQFGMLMPNFSPDTTVAITLRNFEKSSKAEAENEYDREHGALQPAPADDDLSVSADERMRIKKRRKVRSAIVSRRKNALYVEKLESELDLRDNINSKLTGRLSIYRDVLREIQTKIDAMQGAVQAAAAHTAASAHPGTAHVAQRRPRASSTAAAAAAAAVVADADSPHSTRGATGGACFPAHNAHHYNHHHHQHEDQMFGGVSPRSTDDDEDAVLAAVTAEAQHEAGLGEQSLGTQPQLSPASRANHSGQAHIAAPVGGSSLQQHEALFSYLSPAPAAAAEALRLCGGAPDDGASSIVTDFADDSECSDMAAASPSAAPSDFGVHAVHAAAASHVLHAHQTARVATAAHQHGGDAGLGAHSLAAAWPPHAAVAESYAAPLPLSLLSGL